MAYTSLSRTSSCESTNNIIPTYTSLSRTSSCESTNNIIPTYLPRSSSLNFESSDVFHERSLVRKDSPGMFHRLNKATASLLRSLLHFISFPIIVIPVCGCLALPTQLPIVPSLGRRVTGTLFGYRKGYVSFAVQVDPNSAPALIIEFAVSTSTLVKEMSSALVRIALECEKPQLPSRSGSRRSPVRLFNEPMWTMYCNGRKCGHAQSRLCTESDLNVLSTVQSVSVGAGVIPVVEDGKKKGPSEGELLYMRARFERVVGSRDSEAFYMMNPDGKGGPELSIFLLRM